MIAFTTFLLHFLPRAVRIKALNLNLVKNKHVLIKPNFNTADLVPGSTHNDSLVRLVEGIWSLGASSPAEIDLFPADDQSREFRDRIAEVLNQG